MKKNTAALAFAILCGIFGLIGGIMWAACAKTCAGFASATGVNGTMPIGYMIGFIALGIGGALLSLIGGIRAYSFQGGGTALSVLGFLMQAGCLALECFFVEGFSFTLSLCTLVAVLMGLLQSCFAARKP